MSALGQQRLFDEPEHQATLSQWHSPHWLCKRIAEWIPVGMHIIEPSCGSGNIIAALLAAGHPPEAITGVELDAAWAAHALERFERKVVIHCADFLSFVPAKAPQFFVMNCPFENNLHMHFVLRALRFAPVVVGVFPAAFEFSKERDSELWATKGLVVRRARLPDRVDYGGDQSPSFDSVVLKITRRGEPRRVDEVVHVAEECWRRAA